MSKDKIRDLLRRQHPEMPIYLVDYYTDKISMFFQDEQIEDFILEIEPIDDSLPYDEPYKIIFSFRPNYHS